MKKIYNGIGSLVESCIRNVGGGLGRWLRYRYFRNRLGYCGQNVIFGIGVIIQSPKSVFLNDDVWVDNYVVILAGATISERKTMVKENKSYVQKLGELHIEKGVHVAPHCVLQAHGGISIGRFTGVAAGSKIYTLSHHYRNLNDNSDLGQYYFTPMVDIDHQFLISSPVVLGEGCAVGLNSIILPGTTVPDGTWIGVNTSIAGQDLLPNAIYGSNNGKILKIMKNRN